MGKPFLLPSLIVCFLAAVSAAFAQTATLTATVRINPLEIEVTAPPNVTVGQWFEIQVEASNLGPETVKGVKAEINPPTDLQVSGRHGLGVLKPGETKKARWRARALASGNSIVQVEVTGRLGGEQISASDSAVISALGPPIPFWLRLIFGRILRLSTAGSLI